MWITLDRCLIKLSTGAQNLWTTRPSPVQVIHNLTKCLTTLLHFLRCKRAPKGDSSLKLRRCWVGLCLFVSSLSLQTLPVKADINAIDAYKIYAHIKIGSYTEFKCIEKLWTKESNWRPKAKNLNSTAYGIPQLLNMKETNPYKQIDLGLKYIAKHRLYKGNPCLAWAHYKKKGWY
jgi:hypothetical protein